MPVDSGRDIRKQEQEEKERQEQRARETEQRALDAAQDGEMVLVRDAVDAKGNKIAAGTKLGEGEYWPKHRLQFMLQEGHAKIKGAEVKTMDGKEDLAAGQARRMGLKK